MGSGGKTQIIGNPAAITSGDSIASYLADGSGNFLTSTLVGITQRLDVISPSEFAEDTAHVSGDYGTQVLAVRNDAGTTLAGSNGDYSPLSVDANGNLRVSASMGGTYAEDSAHVSGDIGSFSLAVRNDAATSLVSADGDYAPFQVDSIGRLKVIADLTASFDYTYAEDSPHTTGEVGAFVLGVRQDTTAATAGTTGDYTGLQTWSNGELKCVDVANLTNLQQVLTVGTAAVAAPAAALANRKAIWIQNQSLLNTVYVGSATVTSSGATAGIRVSPGSFVEMEAGPAQAVFVIASAAATPVAIWELS